MKKMLLVGVAAAVSLCATAAFAQQGRVVTAQVTAAQVQSVFGNGTDVTSIARHANAVAKVVAPSITVPVQAQQIQALLDAFNSGGSSAAATYINAQKPSFGLTQVADITPGQVDSIVASCVTVKLNGPSVAKKCSMVVNKTIGA